MRPQPDKKQKKYHIEKKMRLHAYAWGMVVGVVLLIGFTYAWYSWQKREAETQVATVQKPYHLVLGSPGETDSQLLSIGGMPSGEIKQIVFSVSCEEAQKAFEYALELVHTDNLKLKYEVYKLVEATEQNTGTIVVEDTVTSEDGNTTTEITYWNKGSILAGTDVSDKRHEQVGLTGAVEADGTSIATENIVNRGTYISYEKTEGSDSVAAIDNGLEMTAGYEPTDNTTTDNSQYFVLEVSWDITTGFDKYEKETDMIYILAKAVQPEPEAQDSTD